MQDPSEQQQQQQQQQQQNQLKAQNASEEKMLHNFVYEASCKMY